MSAAAAAHDDFLQVFPSFSRVILMVCFEACNSNVVASSGIRVVGLMMIHQGCGLHKHMQKISVRSLSEKDSKATKRKALNEEEPVDHERSRLASSSDFLTP